MNSTIVVAPVSTVGPGPTPIGVLLIISAGGVGGDKPIAVLLLLLLLLLLLIGDATYQ
eukprot:COSAG02_NODE_8232_length_2648_cov_5.561789_3_plen_58_part_00